MERTGDLALIVLGAALSVSCDPVQPAPPMEWSVHHVQTFIGINSHEVTIDVDGSGLVRFESKRTIRRPGESEGLERREFLLPSDSVDRYTRAFEAIDVPSQDCSWLSPPREFDERGRPAIVFTTTHGTYFRYEVMVDGHHCEVSVPATPPCELGPVATAVVAEVWNLVRARREAEPPGTPNDPT